MLRIALSAAALLCAPAAFAQDVPLKPQTAAAAPATEGAGAGASESSAAAPAKAAAAKPAKKLICKREAGTGSRTNTPKICLTKEEWKAIDREG